MLTAITLSEVLQVGMFLLYLLSAIIAYLIKRRIDEIDKRFDAGEVEFKRQADRIDRLEDRVTRAESDIRHLPDKDKTHDLEKAIGALQGEVRVLSERIKPIAAISDRLQDAMLEKVHG